jgi:hypothetical protein
MIYYLIDTYGIYGHGIKHASSLDNNSAGLLQLINVKKYVLSVINNNSWVNAVFWDE